MSNLLIIQIEKNSINYGKTLTNVCALLCSCLPGYQDYFKSKTKSNLDKAIQYIERMVISDLNNFERISEVLDADHNKLHHFISDF